MYVPRKSALKPEPAWTFLSNHAHILICVARDPEVRVSEIADLVGIQERTVVRIIHELSDAGYLTVTRVGRNNVYDINLERPLRHPLEAHHHIKEVIAPLLKTTKGRR